MFQRKEIFYVFLFTFYILFKRTNSKTSSKYDILKVELSHIETIGSKRHLLSVLEQKLPSPCNSYFISSAVEDGVLTAKAIQLYRNAYCRLIYSLVRYTKRGRKKERNTKSTLLSCTRTQPMACYSVYQFVVEWLKSVRWLVYTLTEYFTELSWGGSS